MRPLQLRILKRHTSVEEPDFEVFFKAEFSKKNGQPDTSLSVFEIEHHCLVQAHAECVVSWLDAPVKKRGGLAVEDCPADHTARRTPGETQFSFTRSQHLELGFLHEEELRAFARHAFDRRGAWERPASRAEVRTYGQGRLAEGDEEWRGAIANKPKWAKELMAPPSLIPVGSS